MNLEIRVLQAGDASVLDRVADDVFDCPVDARWSAEFLADPRHHLAVAIDDDIVVGMASGIHYVHPDKPPQLFINEVGVASSHQGRGIGRRVLDALLERGRSLGCQRGVGADRRIEFDRAKTLRRCGWANRFRTGNHVHVSVFLMPLSAT